ncbi:MAG: hypothetical protein J6M39_09715 [Lachnospiraceae bacterium]|nr:hypothetical protein [Lachnospiraceae bacterium]
MKQRKKSDKNYCTTCKYWSGNTKLSGDMVYIYDDYGDCQHPISKCGKRSTDISSCSNWMAKY